MLHKNSGPSYKNILLIEDNPADAVLFFHTVKEGNSKPYSITHIEKVEEFNNLYGHTKFDVVMLDLNLPGISEFEAIRYIQQRDESVPIIVLTGDNDEQRGLESVRLGVQDYLVKGESTGEIIRRAIRYSVERKQFQDKIVYLTQHDQLTGLINKVQFTLLLKNALAKAKAEKKLVGVILIDLDNFKHINDACGFETGDELLVEVGKKLQNVMGNRYPVARSGEDSYLILIDNISDTDECADLAEHILQLFNFPFTVFNRLHNISKEEVNLSASIGIATYPTCNEDAVALIKCAEDALQKAKQEGRRNYHFFSEKLDASIQERVIITNGLFGALEREEFTLHYQPQVDLQSKNLLGVEALIRWEHPQLGIIEPNDFIPLAGKSGYLSSITRWVLQTACHRGITIGDENTIICINIYQHELYQSGLVRAVEEALISTGLCPELLALELTETAIMQQADLALSTLRKLKNLGVRLHIDNFGSGYSSLNYLRQLPVDALKIDRQFVTDMVSSREDQKVVKIIIDIAHDLDMTVIAEGVDTEDQAHLLRQMGCEAVQGLYAGPILPDEERR